MDLLLGPRSLVILLILNADLAVSVQALLLTSTLAKKYNPLTHPSSFFNNLVTRRSIAMAADSLKPQSPSATSSAYDVEMDDAFWTFVGPSKSIPGHYVYTKPIHKTEQDDREYRLVRLENGLQALLVHDAKTDKSAASMDISVGHLSDPELFDGIEHRSIDNASRIQPALYQHGVVNQVQNALQLMIAETLPTLH